MTQEQKVAKLEALFQDEDFATKLGAVVSTGDLRKLFAANGVELTAEETAGLVESVAQRLGDSTGELSATQLDGAAGGLSIKSVISIAVTLIKNRAPIILPMPLPIIQPIAKLKR
jgi:hypothetical protein